jgi:hypothetical protein
MSLASFPQIDPQSLADAPPPSASSADMIILARDTHTGIHTPRRLVSPTWRLFHAFHTISLFFFEPAITVKRRK